MNEARVLSGVPFRQFAESWNAIHVEDKLPYMTDHYITYGEHLQENGMRFNIDKNYWYLRGKADCWAGLTWEDNIIKLRCLWVPEAKKGRGYSKMILRALTRSADQSQSIMRLVVRVFDVVNGQIVEDKLADGGLTEQQLIELYSSFGWVIIHDSSTTRPSMIRYPNE